MERRERVLLGVWLWSVAGVTGLFLAPVPGWAARVEAMTRWRVDLVAHALLFGWLMAMPHAAAWRRRRRVVLSMGLGVLAFGYEAGQGMTGYRTVEMADAAANLAGIFAGAGVGRWWSRAKSRGGARRDGAEAGEGRTGSGIAGWRPGERGRG